jgi:hypothetical protein
MKCVETMQLAALLLERTTEQISDNEVSGVVRVPVDDTRPRSGRLRQRRCDQSVINLTPNAR